MMLLKDLLMSLILCANSCLNKNKINAMKILYPYRIIFIITLLLFCDDIYGGSGKEHRQRGGQAQARHH